MAQTCLELRTADGSLLPLATEPVTITIQPSGVAVARVSVYMEVLEGSLLTICPESRQDDAR